MMTHSKLSDRVGNACVVIVIAVVVALLNDHLHPDWTLLIPIICAVVFFGFMALMWKGYAKAKEKDAEEFTNLLAKRLNYRDDGSGDMRPSARRMQSDHHVDAIRYMTSTVPPTRQSCRSHFVIVDPSMGADLWLQVLDVLNHVDGFDQFFNRIVEKDE